MEENKTNNRPATLAVQSVLYNSSFKDIKRTAKSLAKASRVARGQEKISTVVLYWGDCSPNRCVDDEALQRLRSELKSDIDIVYTFFNANLGSALGHNRLSEQHSTDYIVILNPDVVLTPATLVHLIDCFKSQDVGMAESKQTPIEHPKDFDALTGWTSWASTCCAMIPRSLFDKIGGFDYKSFFLYCDDVDFSWLVRRQGYIVVYQPAAVVYHDKRLSPEGGWVTSPAEQYYSAEAALLLAHKWSRFDIVEQALAYFDSCEDEPKTRAAAEFRRRIAAGELTASLDAAHEIGQFIAGNYSKHRYPL